jgi:hypothetical protein
VKQLHIAKSLKVVGKHRHQPGISIYNARTLIRELARAKHRTVEDERLVEDLERATGVPIDELAKLSAQWLPPETPASDKPPPEKSPAKSARRG